MKSLMPVTLQKEKYYNPLREYICYVPSELYLHLRALH